MSNAICVRIGKRIEYVPFRWQEDQLQAYVRKTWVNVEPTGRKNGYGDRVFTVAAG